MWDVLRVELRPVRKNDKSGKKQIKKFVPEPGVGFVHRLFKHRPRRENRLPTQVFGELAVEVHAVLRLAPLVRRVTEVHAEDMRCGEVLVISHVHRLRRDDVPVGVSIQR